MRQYAAKHSHAGSEKIDGVSLVGHTTSKAQLRMNLMQAVAAATSAVSGNEHIRASAWKHVVLEGNHFCQLQTNSTSRRTCSERINWPQSNRMTP
eukprot:4300623-Amphidinium_carterae.1